MLYFDTLPKVVVSDNSGISRIFTNLLARASVLPSIFDNPVLYYEYDIQEGDTPEIIAHKYYGDSYRYWIVLFTNRLLDPQWDWPLEGRVFDEYLATKYPNISPSGVIHHYEKIITQFDAVTSTETVNKVQITEEDYNNLIPSSTIVTLSTGDCSVVTTKKAVSVYEYEMELNQSRRSISLLNARYVDQFESEFKKLMSV